MSGGVETTTTAYVLNVGTVGVVGTFLGMPLDALFLGAFSGFLVLGFNKVSSRMNGLVTVCMGTLLAGSLSPVIIRYLAYHFDLADSFEEEIRVLRPLVPVMIGSGWQWALPRISEAFSRLIDVWLERVMVWARGRK
ncbi:hypothetical protein [Kingella negevensis]|uniref:hypothetical protein n=1 Tax=Kingella negevensis TaxID=1522312 RepID=UPI00050A01D3|nr:hypothetical protein [Kingella negevensis]